MKAGIVKGLGAGLALALALVGCVKNETGAPNQPGNESGAAPKNVVRHESAAPSQSPEPTPARKELSPAQATAPPTTAAAAPSEKSQETQERSRLRQEFQELSARIAELRERAKDMTSTRTRERVAAAVTELEEKRRVIAEQFENLDDWRTSASLAWQDMREGLERAMQELRQAYDKAKSHF